MKWILPISLIILLSFVSTFDSEHKEVNDKTIKKMVEHLTKIRDLFRNLDEEDTGNEPGSEDSGNGGSGEESEESGDSGNGGAGNQTESTSSSGVPATALTTVAMPRNDRAPNKLVDFHSFKAPYEKPRITFVTVFIFSNRLPPRLITFTLTILLKSGLRNLQQSEDTQANCTVDSADANKMGENVNYECEAQKPPNTDVEDVVVHPDIKFDGELQDADSLGFSEQAAEAAGALQEQTEIKKKFITLKRGKWTKKKNTFIITGDVDTGDYHGKVGDKYTLILVNANRRRLESRRLGDVNVPCQITNVKDQMNYTFTCEPGQTINGKLDLASLTSNQGNQDDRSLTLNMNDGYKDLTFDPNDPNNAPRTNQAVYRKSSSGLSGGAIAGIVIACAVVLIIGSVIAMMMRKPAPPLDNSTSVVGLRPIDNYSQ